MIYSLWWYETSLSSRCCIGRGADGACTSDINTTQHNTFFLLYYLFDCWWLTSFCLHTTGGARQSCCGATVVLMAVTTEVIVLVQWMLSCGGVQVQPADSCGCEGRHLSGAHWRTVAPGLIMCILKRKGYINAYSLYLSISVCTSCIYSAPSQRH